MVGANNPKVPGASFAGAFRHGIQPDGLVLLSDALWHRRQVFRIDPAIVVACRVQDVAILSGINAGGVERFYSFMLASN